MDVADLGFRVDSGQVDKASRSLDNLSQSARKTETATERMNRENAEASKRMNAMTGAGNGVTAMLMKMARAAIAAFGAIKVGGLIKEMAMLNSRFEQMGNVMTVVGRNVGLSQSQVERYAKSVQSMGISMLESRNTITSMIQAQLDLSKASELARLAQDAAVIAQINSSEALGRLIYGLKSAQVEVLRTMGLNVNFEAGYKKLAAELGKSTTALTEAEKAQARMNQVVEAGTQIAGAYEASMDSAGKMLGSTERYVEDLKITLGETFSQATLTLVTEYSDSLKSMLSTAKELSADGSLRRWGAELNQFLVDSIREFKILIQVLKTTADILANGLGMGGLQNIKRALAEFDQAMTDLQMEENGKRIQAYFKAYDNLEVPIEMVTRATLEMAKATEDAAEANKDQQDAINKTTDSLKKKLIELTEGARALVAYENANDATVLSLYDQVEAIEAAQEANKNYRNELQSLTDKLYPQAAAVRALMMEYLLLNQAIINGDMGSKAVHDWLDLNVAIHDTPRILKEVQKETSAFGKIWDTTIERLQGGIADMFYDMLERGKVTFDSILDLFKRMVAEMAAQKFVMSIGLGGVSSGAMAGGLAGTGGSAVASATGGAASSVASSAGGGLLSSILGPTGGVGTALRVIRDYGTAIAGIGGAIYGYQQSGWKGAIGGGAGGAGGAIAGSALGMAIAGPVGAAVGKALGGFLGGTLGSKIFGGQYETTRGGIQLGFGDAGFDPLAWDRQTKSGGLFGSTKRRFIFSDLDAELDLVLNESYSHTVDSIRTLYQSIGVAVGDGALEGVRIATLQIGTSGKSEQAQEEIEAQIAQWFSDLQEAMVSSIDSSMNFASLVDLSSSLSSVNAIFDTLGLALNEISISGAKSSQALIEAAGGLESLASSADYYYQNFYTEQERLEKSTAMVTAALADLGYALPETHDGFRRIVEAARDAGAGNEALLASLLNLAPAVDQVIRGNHALAESARQAAAAQEQAAAAQAQAVAQLQSQSRALEIELMRVQGMTAEADAAQYAIDTAGMSEAEKAIFDYNKSLEKQIETIKETQRIEREAIAQRERDLAKAAQERDRAEAAASAARDRAAQQEAALQQSIASERYGLESRLLQLQGNTAALRERELAALHPVNQELQKQIWALEDMAVAQQEAALAADEAARAAEQVQREWRGVANTLLSEVDRIRGGLLTSSGMSFAAAQAQFSILTAQARSGDMEAARAIPDASRTLLDLARTQASSYADFARIAAATASSMESTAFDLPNVDVASSVTQAGEGVKNEIRELKEENRLLRRAIEQIVINTGKSARIWDDVTQGGTSIRTVEADA